MEGKGVLTRNHRQEALSRAYVHAIAARCGLVCSATREYDYGIDLTLHQIARHGRHYWDEGFRLDLQLKSTIERKVVRSQDAVAYDLEAKAYAGLRDPSAGDYRILVLVVFPTNESLWTSQAEEHLLIRGSAYWLWLQGQPASTNIRTVRLSIPRTNVFSVEGVKALMDRVRKEDDL
jgi:hypothetical protein